MGVMPWDFIAAWAAGLRRDWSKTSEAVAGALGAMQATRGSVRRCCPGKDGGRGGEDRPAGGSEKSNSGYRMWESRMPEGGCRRSEGGFGVSGLSGFSAFGLSSCFGFRTSDFVLPAKGGSSGLYSRPVLVALTMPMALGQRQRGLRQAKLAKGECNVN